MRFANGTRACGLGAAGFLNIGLGRGRVGDGDGEADALGLLLLTAFAGVVAAVAAARGDVVDRGGGRLGNLMRSFRDSVVSWRARTGCCCCCTGVGAGSDLTSSRIFSSPSLSSSMTSVDNDNEGTRCARRAVGLVGTGEGAAVASAGVWPWLGVWDTAAADTGGGVGVGRTGAREGAVSSRVR